MSATKLQLSLKIFLIILLFATTALPCGAPQFLFGVIHNNGMPVRNAIVEVSAPGRVIAVMQTGSFGLYSTMVGACPELHTITVRHGRYQFAPAAFWTDGSGVPININIGTASGTNELRLVNLEAPLFRGLAGPR